MEETKKKKKGKAVIVGGSIAGVSCAHSLLLAGWDVVLLEKSSGPPTGNPTGAGLGLDPLAQRIIHSWLPHNPHLLHNSTVPLTIDQVFSFSLLVFFFPFDCSRLIRGYFFIMREKNENSFL